MDFHKIPVADMSLTPNRDEQEQPVKFEQRKEEKV